MNIEASAWVKNNFEALVREYSNQWIAASSDGYAGSGNTFDLVMREIQEREVPLSEVVFIYLTKEAIQ